MNPKKAAGAAAAAWLSIAHQFRCRYGERIRNSTDHQQARIALSPFDPTQVCQIDLGLKCQLFLRQIPLLSVAPDIPSQDRAQILHCRKGRDQAYSLQGL